MWPTVVGSSRRHRPLRRRGCSRCLPSSKDVGMSAPRRLVRAEAYERVVHLRTSVGDGTGFTIDRAGSQWLVTARHLLPDNEAAPELRVINRYGQWVMRLGFIPALGDAADVAVAQLET